MAAIAKQKEQNNKVKAKGSDAGRSSTVKRVSSALWIMSWYLVPMHMGSVYCSLNQYLFNSCIFNEATMLVRNSKKDVHTSILVEWLIFLNFIFMQTPRYVLTKTVLVANGMP